MSTLFCFIISAIWLCQLMVFRHLETNALPSTMLAPTTHIVSFVHQQNTNEKSKEFSEFDFEGIEKNGKGGDVIAIPHIQQQTPLSKLYGRLVEQLDKTLDNDTGVYKSYKHSTIPFQSNDMLGAQRNTLDNAEDIFGRNEQHESAAAIQNNSDLGSASMWIRMKQSIPVLEPVKHLLNTVRDGAFNHTAHAARQHHQLVNSMMSISQMDQMHTTHQNESSAIETEEEREMANESSEFQLLDSLGSIFGIIWGFFSNIQRVFAASSGNASAALSSSSSSSSN